MKQHLCFLVCLLLVAHCGRKNSLPVFNQESNTAPVPFDFGNSALPVEYEPEEQSSLPVPQRSVFTDRDATAQLLLQQLQLRESDFESPFPPKTQEQLQYEQALRLYRILADIDLRFGLYIKDNNLWKNWSNGQNEVWLKSNHSKRKWLYLLPNGELYEWKYGTKLSGNKIGQIPPFLYERPEILATAADQYCSLFPCLDEHP